MNLEKVVCIKTGFFDYNRVGFTKDKKYSLMDDSEQSIQIINNYGNGVAMQRSLFDAHFKYLSDIREEKLKEIGI